MFSCSVAASRHCEEERRSNLGSVFQIFSCSVDASRHCEERSNLGGGLEVGGRRLPLRVIDYVESSICEARSNLGLGLEVGGRSVELFSWECGWCQFLSWEFSNIWRNGMSFMTAILGKGTVLRTSRCLSSETM